MYGLYQALTALATPLLPLWLRLRLARGKEDAARISERLGQAGITRPAGKLLWIHAASVGEANTALPLIEALLAASPALHILLTTVTVTSAALMRERLPERAIHQFAPIDTPRAVGAFLRHWKPDVALWVDSELWPNLIVQTYKQGAVMGIINARMSERSARRWGYAKEFIRELLACFTLCFAQSEADASCLRALGMSAVAGIGNLKYDAAPLPCDERELAALRARTGKRPHWLAASTHAGEEEIVARVHSRLKLSFPDILTIILPRHASRGSAIAAALAPLAVAQRSMRQPLEAGTDIYLADTMGETGLFYRLAPVAFIGKSLAAYGGQNPLEAARLGCAILSGPHTQNFDDVYAALYASNACLSVADEEGLFQAVKSLLDDAARVRELSENALACVRSRSGTLERIMNELQPYLV